MFRKSVSRIALAVLMMGMFCPTVAVVLSQASAQTGAKAKKAGPQASPPVAPAPNSGAAAKPTAYNGQAPDVSDPLALQKATQRLAEKRRLFDQRMTEIKKAMQDRPKLNLADEKKLQQVFAGDVITYLREERDIVLKNRAHVHEAYLAYIDALRQVIVTLERDAVQIENRLNNSKQPIRSSEIRDNLIKLATTSRTTATTFGERLKTAQTDLATIDNTLAMVDESGILLDFWQGQVAAMLEGNITAETAKQSTEGLRAFARRLQEGLDQFFAVQNSLQVNPDINGKK